jgi:hypothetical protein
VTPNWTTGNNPASGSTFAILPSTSAWDEQRGDHTATNSFGQGVSSVQGDVTGSVDSVIDPVALTGAADVYHAEISMDIGASADEYTVVWFKNGEAQSTLTVAANSPLIYVINREGSVFVSEQAMLNVEVPPGGATTGYFKFNEPTNRLGAGDTAVVRVKATIGGTQRIFVREITRN